MNEFLPGQRLPASARVQDSSIPHVRHAIVPHNKAAGLVSFLLLLWYSTMDAPIFEARDAALAEGVKDIAFGSVSLRELPPSLGLAAHRQQGCRNGVEGVRAPIRPLQSSPAVTGPR